MYENRKVLGNYKWQTSPTLLSCQKCHKDINPGDLMRFWESARGTYPMHKVCWLEKIRKGKKKRNIKRKKRK